MDQFNQETAILICSSDNYEDVWRPFFFFFKKFWPDCPYPLYLMTNRKQYPDPSVATIATGQARDWSSGFLQAVEHINTPYIIVLMEDYFLLERPSVKFLEEAIAFMKKEKASYLRLFPCPGADNEITSMAGVAVGEVFRYSEYRVSLQASIWHIDYLRRLVKKGESAWDLEIIGTERSNSLADQLYSVCGHSPPPMSYFCTAVVKGYWDKKAIELCRQHGLEVDLKKRPVQPFYLRKNIRPIIFLLEQMHDIKAKLLAYCSFPWKRPAKEIK